jgi:hypothetical protein
MSRRILLALICSPLVGGKIEQSRNHYIVSLDDDFSLELRFGKRVIKLTGDDIMVEFEPIPKPDPIPFDHLFIPVNNSSIPR